VLKRYSPGQSLPLAYWRFWPRWLQQDAPPDAQSQDWALILAGMALMGRNAHQPKLTLGTVLAEQGYSEQRLERLLTADDASTRRQLFARTTRFLAAKGAAIDWLEAARFVLAGAELREVLAHHIARDYYATQYRLNSNKE
jgi:CRISPR type I-E-associated protein CasB/Cse2